MKRKTYIVFADGTEIARRYAWNSAMEAMRDYVRRHGGGVQKTFIGQKVGMNHVAANVVWSTPSKELHFTISLQGD